MSINMKLISDISMQLNTTCYSFHFLYLINFHKHNNGVLIAAVQYQGCEMCNNLNCSLEFLFVFYFKSKMNKGMELFQQIKKQHIQITYSIYTKFWAGCVYIIEKLNGKGK